MRFMSIDLKEIDSFEICVWGRVFTAAASKRVRCLENKRDVLLEFNQMCEDCRTRKRARSITERGDRGCGSLIRRLESTHN